MARRGVQGYSEKSYCEIASFRGINATNDPQPDGYFKHLVNFDISNTGQSVVPRKGFLVTMLDDINLSANTLVYKDERSGAYIAFDPVHLKAYTVDIDFTDLESYKITEFSEINVETTISPSVEVHGSLVHVYDINAIKRAVFKGSYYVTVGDESVSYTNWLTLTYDGTNLQLNIIDMDTQHSYTDRNLSSFASIIPAPLQKIHTEASLPISFADTVGLVYVNKGTDYYLNRVYRSEDYLFKPHFELQPAHLHYGVDVGDASWAVRVDVVSTNTIADPLDEKTVFRGAWYDVGGTKLSFGTFDNDNTSSAVSVERHYKGATVCIVLVPKDATAADAGEYIYYRDGATPTVTRPAYMLSGEQAEIVDAINAIFGAMDNPYKTIKGLTSALDPMKDQFDCVLYKFSDTLNTIQTISAKDAIVSKDVLDIGEDYSSYEKIISLDSAISKLSGGYANDCHILVRTLLGKATYNYHEYADVAAAMADPLRSASLKYAPLVVISELDEIDVNPLQYVEPLQVLYRPFRETDVTLVNLFALDGSVRVDTTELPGLLNLNKFFAQGYRFDFYFYPYLKSEITGLTFNEATLKYDAWALAAYTAHTNVVYGKDDIEVTKLIEFITDEPTAIRSGYYTSFDNTRIIAWAKNVLFISEEGAFDYFREECRREFSEEIVKVIQYKTILMVFTVQHIYAVYQEPYKYTEQGVDAGGKEILIERTSYVWAKQCVLYNVPTDIKYADAIQVFNQMVLFYSADGQMFLIKPNTMIDSNVQFAITYFNKNANDILANYDVYINERLENYNIVDESTGVFKLISKDDVIIKCLVSINQITIYYFVPGVITYILIFDIINNYYKVYDTLTFTDIKSIMNTSEGTMLLVRNNERLYFTKQYHENSMDANVDIACYYNFKKTAVNTLIDTGTLNINNHLRKRFRDLLISFKNLSTSTILYSVHVHMDDQLVIADYDPTIVVKEPDGHATIHALDTANHNALINLVDNPYVGDGSRILNYDEFTETNLLMDWTDYTSNKLLVRKAYIVGTGKTIRVKIHLVSKGAYKVQNFGIIYKERRV